MNNSTPTSTFQNHLRQLFNECDIDQNGSLTRDEFRQLCSKIGLNAEASEEAFLRLDCDRDQRISFQEFLTGFNRCQSSLSGQAQNHHLDEHQQQFLQAPVATGPNELGSRSPTRQAMRLSPVASRAAIHKPASTGAISLGSTVPARFRPTSAGSAETSATSFSELSYESSASRQQGTTINNAHHDSVSPSNNNNMVVYSSDLLTHQHQPNHHDGSQYNSLLSQSSTNNGVSSLTGNSQSAGLNVQDLLDCVQKLQNENQVLSKIFFKDKRERDEYISQLGEEFDQQVREVEERANKRAKEELEGEKRRLREMMFEEREQLQHHYRTIERMSNLVKSTYEERKSNQNQGAGGGGDGSGADSIDLVRSKLEDTHEENKQLKKSLADTKTDVAMIWREMFKLKKRYEDQLSSAYERNEETKNECDHIKKQLNLMKDSNRKLQDASDVITSYITDKVEPVIKIATEGGGGGSEDGGSLGYQHRNASDKFLGAGGSSRGFLIASANNSRRGSVLSDYLNGGDDDDTDCDVENCIEFLDPQREAHGPRKIRSRSNNNKINNPTNNNIDHNNTNDNMNDHDKENDDHREHPLITPSNEDVDDDEEDIRKWLNKPANNNNKNNTNGDNTNDNNNDNYNNNRETLAQHRNIPRLSTTTTEPSSVAILKKAKARDSIFGQVSNSSSASSITSSTTSNSKATHNMKRATMITTKDKNLKQARQQRQKKSNHQNATNKFDLLGANQSESIDLDSDLEASDGRRSGKPLATSTLDGPLKNKINTTAVTQIEDNTSGSCDMVAPSDGPAVATYDIILVGDSFVGKSSLASRFIEGSYVRGIISTTSIDFKTKDCKVDGVNYTINLWDTA